MTCPRNVLSPGLSTQGNEQSQVSLCENTALTLYVSSLAGWDLGLAVGSWSCCVGVACPNDPSTSSHSASVTSGINLVREIENFKTSYVTADWLPGTKSQTMSFIGVTVFYITFSFTLRVALHLCSPLAWTVLTHLTIKKRLSAMLTWCQEWQCCHQQLADLVFCFAGSEDWHLVLIGMFITRKLFMRQLFHLRESLNFLRSDWRSGWIPNLLHRSLIFSFIL